MAHFILESITPSKKRKYTHHISAPFDIQTRGAKLPRYYISDFVSGSITPSMKRKYTHHIPAPSDIQTRGAKLPRYYISDFVSGSITPSKKRKYTHHIPAPSDIQTRGAKLPRYSFERKTHKKILLSHSSPPQRAKPKLELPAGSLVCFIDEMK